MNGYQIESVFLTCVLPGWFVHKFWDLLLPPEIKKKSLIPYFLKGQSESDTLTSVTPVYLKAVGVLIHH